MLFREIVERIDMFRGVPVIYDDGLRCSTVTYLKPHSKKERGIYLPKCTTEMFYENVQINNPIEFKQIKSIIENTCECNEYTYSLFNVLHELGHWVHYTQFIKQGHNDCDYLVAYETDRIKLHLQREVEAKSFRGNTVEEFNNKYSKLYCELTTEKEANRFAATHLKDCL